MAGVTLVDFLKRLAPGPVVVKTYGTAVSIRRWTTPAEDAAEAAADDAFWRTFEGTPEQLVEAARRKARAGWQRFELDQAVTDAELYDEEVDEIRAADPEGYAEDRRQAEALIAAWNAATLNGTQPCRLVIEAGTVRAERLDVAPLPGPLAALERAFRELPNRFRVMSAAEFCGLPDPAEDWLAI